MEQDEFLDILLSPEEAKVTWARLLGEEDEAGTAPASVPPADRTTTGLAAASTAVWPPPTIRATPGPTAAAPGDPPPTTTTRRRVPRVGTRIQRSGDQGARKLIQLAFPPPPPPTRPRQRPHLRVAAPATTTRPAITLTSASCLAARPTPKRQQVGQYEVASQSTTAPGGSSGPTGTLTRQAIQQDPTRRQGRPNPGLRIISEQPCHRKITLRATPNIPVIVLDDDDPPPSITPLQVASTTDARAPRQYPEVPAPAPRQTVRPATRAVTVEPGVVLQVPQSAIHQRRKHHTKAYGANWTLRFDRAGVLRSVVKR